jgi:hypothetical protein
LARTAVAEGDDKMLRVRVRKVYPEANFAVVEIATGYIRGGPAGLKREVVTIDSLVDAPPLDLPAVTKP